MSGWKTVALRREHGRVVVVAIGRRHVAMHAVRQPFVEYTIIGGVYPPRSRRGSKAPLQPSSLVRLVFDDLAPPPRVFALKRVRRGHLSPVLEFGSSDEDVGRVVIGLRDVREDRPSFARPSPVTLLSRNTSRSTPLSGISRP